MPDDIEQIFLDYNPEHSLKETIDNFEEQLSKITDDIILVWIPCWVVALNFLIAVSMLKK